MELTSQHQVDVTKKKRRLLEKRLAATRLEANSDTYARQLSMRSLKRMVNQMTEEIVRFECREKEKEKALLAAASTPSSG